ncbi:MAG: hypothetical protein JRI68_22975 [Deltaproteobacteria bacterium]|nr:hypothetical protein [Deltaproteobacteria bacterium]
MSKDDENGASAGPDSSDGPPSTDDPSPPDSAAKLAELDQTRLVDPAAPPADEGDDMDVTRMADEESKPDELGGTQLMGDVAPVGGMDGTVLVVEPDFAEETPAQAVDVEPADETPTPSREVLVPAAPDAAVVAVAADVVAVEPAAEEELEELEPEEDDEDDRPTLIRVSGPASTPDTAPDLPEGQTIEREVKTLVKGPQAGFGPLPFGVPTKGPDPEATQVADRAPAAEPQPAPPASRAAKAPMPGWAKALAVLAIIGGPLGYMLVRGVRNRQASAPRPPKSTATAQPKAPKGPPAKPTKKAPPARPKPTATPTASATAEAPPAKPERAADLGKCVASVFPSDDSPPSEWPNVEAICSATDARETVKKMSVLMVGGQLGAAAKQEWVKLGWYRMARMQVARARCCGDVPPLTTIEALSACGLDDALAAFAAAGTDSAALGAAADAYDKAATCLFKAQASKMFGQRRRPSGFERGVFRESLGLE